jgi:hypothetical protein
MFPVAVLHSATDAILAASMQVCKSTRGPQSPLKSFGGVTVVS